MRISTQTGNTAGRLGDEKAIELLAAAGYDALDYSMFGMVNDAHVLNSDDYVAYAQNLRKKAESCGVVFTQSHAPFNFDWKDESKFEVYFSRIERSIEISAIMGCECVVVHPLHHILYKGNEAKLKEMNMDFYKRLIPVCQKNNIKVAVENMFQQDPLRKYIVNDVCASPEEHVDYVDTLNKEADCFVACLDIGHVVLVGESPARHIKMLGSRLQSLHIHDNNHTQDQHTIMGCGKINYNEVTSALKEIGYSSDFTLEADAFLRGIETDFLPTALKYMCDTAKYWAKKITD